MTETILNALMKMFAILVGLGTDVSTIISRNFVASYLKTQFSGNLVEKALTLFDENLKELSVPVNLNYKKKISVYSVKILVLCDQINREVHIKEKFQILFSLIKFSKYFEDNFKSGEIHFQTISDTIKTISDGLLIRENEYQNCSAFISSKFYKVPEKDKVLVISDDSAFRFTEINHLLREIQNNQIFFLRIKQADIYIFYYVGESSMQLGGKNIFPRHIYLFPKGSSLKSENSSTIYYNDIVTGYLKKNIFNEVVLDVANVEFQYRNSRNGLKKLSLSARSGELTGIMGGSGSGKSTLLKVLNGSLKPASGDIFINGHNLHKDKEKLKGIIGYVPQDDLLIDELTVYQNLWFRARLCLGNLSIEKTKTAIEDLLYSLDLIEIKDMKVGSPLKKFISGGQRKRLNIALELLMEPYILFVDEPTSGLSSKDSENVVQLLKEQSLQGKMVIVTIHQPSSNLFRMFDELFILDKGGFPVYYGNPLDSFTYLKSIAHRVDADDNECQCCGNVQTDDILNVVEARQVNEFGEFTNERLIPPESWYELFQNQTGNNKEPRTRKNPIPPLKFKAQKKIKQFITFCQRNYFSKIADKQFVLISMLIPPLLAVILAFFTRYVKGTPENPREYIFSLNENIPAYIFMCVIVSLFLGLIISAEEIIKDRKIQERETFLNLSRISYLNSKILLLFLLTGFQMLIFTILGNYILEIKGMNFSYWLILFSTGCFAVMLGLNVSSGFKSAITVYINIPFILVPLILLAGIIVKYDKLHYSVASAEYTPVVGDLMASRWAYEALMVNQFSKNNYQKHYFEVDRYLSNAQYELNFLIPELLHKTEDYERYLLNTHDSAKAIQMLSLIQNSLRRLPENSHLLSAPGISKITDYADPVKFSAFLNTVKSILTVKTNLLEYQKDSITENLLSGGMTSLDLIKLKENNHNVAVSEMVLNTNEIRKIIETDGKLIRKDSPIYQPSHPGNGRAPFFAALKSLGGIKINTLYFNAGVIWLMSLLLYFSLIFNLPGKLSGYPGEK